MTMLGAVDRCLDHWRFCSDQAALFGFGNHTTLSLQFIRHRLTFVPQRFAMLFILIAGFGPALCSTPVLRLGSTRKISLWRKLDF